MNIERRQLGGSDMLVSRLGLGCFAFAGDKSTGSHLGQAIRTPVCVHISSVRYETAGDD